MYISRGWTIYIFLYSVFFLRGVSGLVRRYRRGTAQRLDNAGKSPLGNVFSSHIL